jgi:hypothetical protein
MATATVGTGSSPDAELDLGYHTVTFETDSDTLARQAAERINAAVKAKFMQRYPFASYSLDLEIVGILPGSRRVVTKAKGKKTIWGRFREVFVAMGILGGAIGGYGDFKGGLDELRKDIERFYEEVIREKPQEPPVKDYKWDSDKPIET